MTQFFLVSSLDWAALRIMLVHALWQGPLVLVLALLGEALTRRRPRAAFAMSFGSLLLMPVLALATHGGAFTALSRGVVEFNWRGIELAGPMEASALSWSHWTNVAVVSSWACLAALLIARSLVMEWHSRKRLLSRCRDLDASWRQRFIAMSIELGLKQSVRIVATREEDVPLAFGWLRPVVALPEAMLSRVAVDQIELLVLHELMHVRRRDYPMVLIQHFVRCLFFYNPAVWYLMKLINQHRELACDRDVLNLGVAPRSYAAALVELEGLRHGAPGVSAGGGDLLGRVHAILDMPPQTSPLAQKRWATALGLATLGFAAVACAGRDPGATGDYGDAFTVDLFANMRAFVNGTLVRDDTEIAVQAFHADRNAGAFIRAHENVEIDRAIDVLESLKRVGLTRVAFARVGHDDSETRIEQ